MPDSFSNTSLEYWRQNPIAFIEQCLINPETGAPFELLPAERTFLQHAFTIGPQGKLLYCEWVYSCPKKSGKTTFGALVLIVMVLLFGGSYPEAFALANDQEQAQSRVFEMCRRIVLASPLLRADAQITQYKIAFPSFNATIQAIASDAGSAAGSNPTISCFDELWAYTSERSRRLWDEMNVPPTRKISARLTCTYAGYSGESVLLEELYRRGLQQPLIGEDLYAGDGLLMFWSHKPIAPWQDEAWLTSMRRERASAFERQVLNQFASSSSQFVDLSKWDRCVDPALGHVAVDLFLPVFIGVDASFKHDSTAICVVSFDQSRQQVRLVTHKVFQPTSAQPLNFELTVEAALLNMARSYQVQKCLFDPWQMQAVAQRLAKQGLPVEEFPQTSPNLTAASQNLFDLIESQGLVMYPDEQMRLAISRAVAIETPRGWRIGKQNQAHRIDLIIALCMGCLAATQGQKEPFFDKSWSFVDGRPIGAPPASEEQRQAQAKQTAADHYANRLQAYLLSGGGGNGAIPFNRDGTINWRRLPSNGSGF
jgi:phage terminase large subunit-like protein